MKITLTAGEERAIRLLGQARQEMNDQSGVRDIRIANVPSVQIHIDGMGAEFAVAKALNICPDLSLNPRKGGEDMRTWRGFTVDVKHTRRKGGRLLAHLGKNTGDADLYILVTGTLPHFEIEGWAWATELINPESITDLGYGPTYALGKEQLHPFTLGESDGRYQVLGSVEPARGGSGPIRVPGTRSQGGRATGAAAPNSKILRPGGSNDGGGSAGPRQGNGVANRPATILGKGRG